jgi:flagellar biosynthetic protein FlhB
MSFLAILIGLPTLGPLAVRALYGETRSILSSAGETSSTVDAASGALSMLTWGLLPFLGLTFVLAIAGGIAQVGFVFAPKAAKPKWSHLSPKKALQRFKPSIIGWELVRTILKLGVLAVILWQPTTTWLNEMAAPHGLEKALALTWSELWNVLTRAAILAAVIAGADYAIARYRHNKEMKMTRQELIEDLKRSEGDPLLRGLRRRRALEISRNRMIRDVASADVLITNPTRLAIGLRYESDDPAPRVVARGSGKLAARLRKEAYRNGVPVIEDKPLARVLFRKTRVGQFVPVALFEAVAVVLAVAYRRRGRRFA